MVGAQYVLSLEKYDASTGNAKPKIHSAGLMADYNLSKRTDVYVQAAYQHIAGDKTNSILDNAFIPVPTRRRRRRTRWPCASRCATSSDVTRFSVLHATPARVCRGVFARPQAQACRRVFMVRRNARPTDVAGIGRKRALVPSTVTGQRMTIRRYTVCFRDGRHPHDPRCRPPPSRPAAIRPHRALAAHPRGVSRSTGAARCSPSPPASAAAASDARPICTVVADAATGQMLVQQGDCATRVTPASTFKVAISLMGFDAGVLKDAHTRRSTSTPATPTGAAHRGASRPTRRAG